MMMFFIIKNSVQTKIIGAQIGNDFSLQRERQEIILWHIFTLITCKQTSKKSIHFITNTHTHISISSSASKLNNRLSLDTRIKAGTSTRSRFHHRQRRVDLRLPTSPSSDFQNDTFNKCNRRLRDGSSEALSFTHKAHFILNRRALQLVTNCIFGIVFIIYSLWSCTIHSVKKKKKKMMKHSNSVILLSSRQGCL